MWKKCAQSHRFGLGRVGGAGIPLGGGVGEPRICVHVYMYNIDMLGCALCVPSPPRPQAPPPLPG